MNSTIFKKRVVDAFEVFALVQIKVWSWVSAKIRFALFSYSY